MTDRIAKSNGYHRFTGNLPVSGKVCYSYGDPTSYRCGTDNQEKAKSAAKELRENGYFASVVKVKTGYSIQPLNDRKETADYHLQIWVKARK